MTQAIHPNSNLPKPDRLSWVIVIAALLVVGGHLVYDLLIDTKNTGFVTGFFFFTAPPGYVLGLFAPRRPYFALFVCYILSFVLLVGFFREGVVCMLMASPVLFSGMAVGAFLGQFTRRYLANRRQKIAASIAFLVVYHGGAKIEKSMDDPSRHPWHLVQSSLKIEASPAQVFAMLTGPSLSLPNAWPSILYIGLPIPRSMQVTKPGPDGEVVMHFNHGRALASISSWQQNRSLAFVIKDYQLSDPPFFRTRLAVDQHYGLKTERVADWLSFGELRYDLEATSDGYTRLTRTNHFQRHLFPDFYFGWMQETIIKAGTDALLQHIKARCEANLDRPYAKAP